MKQETINKSWKLFIMILFFFVNACTQVICKCLQKKCSTLLTFHHVIKWDMFRLEFVFIWFSSSCRDSKEGKIFIYQWERKGMKNKPLFIQIRRIPKSLLWVALNKFLAIVWQTISFLIMKNITIYFDMPEIFRRSFHSPNVSIKHIVCRSPTKI